MLANKDILYIFLHIPKCGGTTVADHFRVNFHQSEILAVYRHEYPELIERAQVKKFILALSPARRKALKMIFGHQVYYGIHKLFPDRRVRYVTFIRRPAERLVSAYNYKLMGLLGDRELLVESKSDLVAELAPTGQILSFADWLAANQSNKVALFLDQFFYNRSPEDIIISSDQMTRLLTRSSDFYFVGLTDEPTDFYFFYRLLGLKKFLPNQNISKKYFQPADWSDVEELVRHLAGNDQLIYEHFVRLNRAFKTRHNLFTGLDDEIKNYNRSPAGLYQRYRWYLLKRLYALSLRLKRRSAGYAALVDLIKSWRSNNPAGGCLKNRNMIIY